MAVYTEVSDEELEAFVAGYGIGQVVSCKGIAEGIEPGQDVGCRITYEDGRQEEITLTCRVDTLDEVEYYRHGGILQYVLRNLTAAA